MRDLIFGTLWTALLPLSLYAAHLGILLWIWVALLAPTDMLYGVLNTVPFNKLVAIAAIFVLVTTVEKKRFYLDRMIVLISLYGIVIALSYIFQEEYNPFTDLVFDKIWKILVLAILITGTLASRHRLHQAALVVSIAFGFFMVKEGLIFLLTAGGHKIEGNAATGDNNGLALALLMTIPLVLYVARYTEVIWMKRAMQITAALGAVTVVASYSRGGFVGLIVLAMMLLKNSKHRFRLLIALGALAVIMLMLTPEAWFNRVHTIGEAGEDDSFLIRLTSWKVNTLIALDHPLLGGGLDASLGWGLWSTHVEEASNWLFQTPWIGKTYVAHSIYFQVLGDTGFTGLLLFLSILFTAFRMTVKVQRMARGDPSLAWASDLARALQMSFAVYCVSGAALSLVYFELVYVLLAMVSRTHQTVREMAAKQVAPQAIAVRHGRLQPAYRRAA